jgi:NAD(P)-dependent dehydrogenase (short-subunit alcohol dehydrogenase family)
MADITQEAEMTEGRTRPRLGGRLALITAAGSGMGRASARLFAAEGAHVIVTDLDETAANETVELISGDGGSASARRLDVTDLDGIAETLREVEEEHGVLHVLFNHAGLPGAPGLDITEADFDRAIAVNLKSGFFITSFAAPLLRKADGKGSVIFTSSIGGVAGSHLSPVYSAAKGGVVVMMKSLALHLAHDAIRVNAICPGPIDTPMFPAFFSDQPNADPQQLVERLMTTIPLGRRGLPQEIASAALFLASDDSSFVTGVALPVDGGFLAR